jgi:molybdopterin molybdotransferase
MLLAQIARAGGIPLGLGIARDTPESLRPAIEKGLEQDVLILSGSVSAGKLDLVPGILRELGVHAHFHKVDMKPGKPFLFGMRGGTLVFGLPGNPVSAFVCFELFVRPALQEILGAPLTDWRFLTLTGGSATGGSGVPGWMRHGYPTVVQAALAVEFSYRTDRPTYHPARLHQVGEGKFTVQIAPLKGSPDLLGLTRANALALIPVGEQRYARGETIQVMLLEDILD